MLSIADCNNFATQKQPFSLREHSQPQLIRSNLADLPVVLRRFHLCHMPEVVLYLGSVGDIKCLSRLLMKSRTSRIILLLLGVPSIIINNPSLPKELLQRSLHLDIILAQLYQLHSDRLEAILLALVLEPRLVHAVAQMLDFLTTVAHMDETQRRAGALEEMPERGEGL